MQDLIGLCHCEIPKATYEVRGITVPSRHLCANFTLKQIIPYFYGNMKLVDVLVLSVAIAFLSLAFIKQCRLALKKAIGL